MTDLHDKARDAADHLRARFYIVEADSIAALLAENERLTARVQHTQQWYAERWQWMQHWFRTTGKDLPIADQFWSIIANGTPDVNTPPTYQQQLNIALHRAEAAEAQWKALCEAEPLMLLHTGKIHDDGEQDDWDSEADSGKRIDAYCRKHPGQTIALIPRPSMESEK